MHGMITVSWSRFEFKNVCLCSINKKRVPTDNKKELSPVFTGHHTYKPQIYTIPELWCA